MHKIIINVLALLLLVFTSMAAPLMAQDQAAMSMDELLRQVEKGRVTDNRENQAREKRFDAARSEQQGLLSEAKRTRGITGVQPCV